MMMMMSGAVLIKQSDCKSKFQYFIKPNKIPLVRVPNSFSLALPEFEIVVTTNTKKNVRKTAIKSKMTYFSKKSKSYKKYTLLARTLTID